MTDFYLEGTKITVKMAVKRPAKISLSNDPFKSHFKLTVEKHVKIAAQNEGFKINDTV